MEFEVNGRKIGDGHPLFFIAEAGVNHNGSLQRAKEMIYAAKEAGADCVKFQTFKTEKLSTLTAPKSSYHIETTGDDKKQSWFELLKTQELDREAHAELIRYSKEVGIIFSSTPYDQESADLLHDLGISFYKIASTDTNNTPFLRYLASKRLPMIISTAMSNLEEVSRTVEEVRAAGLRDLALLQCTGNYPARIEDSNLRVMQSYRQAFNCLVGYSDHVPGMVNVIAATALGAAIFEKHFTLDKSLPGPDHRMSMDPSELRATLDVIRQTEAALGSSNKRVLDSERENRTKLRKSLVAAVSITKDTVLTRDMISIKRPGSGMEPGMLEQILGKRLLQDLDSDTVINEDMLA